MTFDQALSYIDFNTLGVLVGMMIIVGIVKNTGIFEYLAIYASKKVKGDPWKIILSLSIITAVTSAFLDNVTTVLLIVPMTFVITDTLNLEPLPFLIPEIMSCAPQLKLPVFHCTDGALRAVNHKLIRRIKAD